VEITTQIITLITGLAGLISAGVAAYFAIKTFVQSLKNKKATEIWSLIMTMADAAMTEAEASGKAGVDKKQMVFDSVSAGLKAAGLDISDFLDQLSSYIDDTITFANGLQKAKENKELNK
jgi:hypothetical protein